MIALSMIIKVTIITHTKNVLSFRLHIHVERMQSSDSDCFHKQLVLTTLP